MVLVSKLGYNNQNLRTVIRRINNIIHQNGRCTQCNINTEGDEFDLIMKYDTKNLEKTQITKI